MRVSTAKKRARPGRPKKRPNELGSRTGIFMDSETRQMFEKFCFSWDVTNRSAEVCSAIRDWIQYHGYHPKARK